MNYFAAILAIAAAALPFAAGAQEMSVHAAAVPAAAPGIPWEPRFSDEMKPAGAEAPDDASIAAAVAAARQGGAPTPIVPAAYVAGAGRAGMRR
ncbi:MAG: hypothetical protein AB7O49_22100 [Sphingomonadales bacterium]